MNDKTEKITVVFEIKEGNGELLAEYLKQIFTDKRLRPLWWWTGQDWDNKKEIKRKEIK